MFTVDVKEIVPPAWLLNVVPELNAKPDTLEKVPKLLIVQLLL
jgi:hypothetical protein